MAQTITLPLATVTVREARQFSVPFAFEVISPRESVVLQAQSQEEMQQWCTVIQNATASLLGCSRAARMSLSSMEGTVFGRVRQVDGNKACVDCGATQPPPAWASINLGTPCLHLPTTTHRPPPTARRPPTAHPPLTVSLSQAPCYASRARGSTASWVCTSPRYARSYGTCVTCVAYVTCVTRVTRRAHLQGTLPRAGYQGVERVPREYDDRLGQHRREWDLAQGRLGFCRHVRLPRPAAASGCL